MEFGVGVQHAITRRRGFSDLSSSLVHSPLAIKAPGISPKMMQVVARMYSQCQNDCRALVVTGYGSTGRAAELSFQVARGMALMSQQSVLLVDADLARPALHTYFQTSTAAGLAELVSGKKSLQEAVYPTSDELLFFLPAGDPDALGPRGRLAPVCVDDISAVRFFQRVVIHAGPLLETSSKMVVIAESDDVLVLGLTADVRQQEADFHLKGAMGTAINSFRQNAEERLTNTMESGAAMQHAITSRKGRGSTGVTFAHSTLPAFSSPVSPEMMQTVARMHSLCQNDCRVLAVTGWDAADQAAELSLQMARGLAALSQQSVLLVDADFVSATLHEQLQTPATPGLAELASGKSTLQDVVRPTSDETLFFLPTGAAEAMGPGGLSAPACAGVLSVLRFFQWVVIHTGPLLDTTSAMVITPDSDAVILALAAGLRRREEAEQLKRQVAALNGRLLGAVLTKRPASKPGRLAGWHL